MAAEWRLDSKGEKTGARRVCTRVYEELDEFIEEVQLTWGDAAYDVYPALEELRAKFHKVLPYDSEEEEA